MDLEANSMYAYREQICLLQISIPTQDYIVDPLAAPALMGLGQLLADPAVEKVFHAAEYDLMLLKREYGWCVNNLFDTMWAARILGYKKYGLANILESLCGVHLDKRYQRANWCKRPLSADHLTYAQHDTHHLLWLRDHLAAELESRACLEEAQEIFAEQTEIELSDNDFQPEDFWSISGAHKLSRQQQAILRELAIFRDQEAQRRDRPLFKVFNDRTLSELARLAPTRVNQMHRVYGMSKRQVQRYGDKLLQVVQRGRQASPPPIKRHRRPPDEVLNRYDALHDWRKQRARARGVESDVVVSKDALWAIAKANPADKAALKALNVLGPWRFRTYADEIITVIRKR